MTLHEDTRGVHVHCSCGAHIRDVEWPEQAEPDEQCADCEDADTYCVQCGGRLGQRRYPADDVYDRTYRCEACSKLDVMSDLMRLAFVDAVVAEFARQTGLTRGEP